jgi:hypothetical protein
MKTIQVIFVVIASILNFNTIQSKLINKFYEPQDADEPPISASFRRKIDYISSYTFQARYFATNFLCCKFKVIRDCCIGNNKMYDESLELIQKTNLIIDKSLAF